ncbi:MAG TPA: hypothetical protein VFH88_01675 [Candidatus Krumholzibacteria bacterium]|nr:hypothetical protein [Candidatus Krumholzibacteria bacterium]
MKIGVWMAGAALIVIWTAAPAGADPHYSVEFYADAAMSSCALDAHNAGIVDVHIFHTGEGSSTGLLFSAYPPACWPNVVWLDDHLAQPWANIGSTQVPLGLSIGYGACLPLPIYVGYVRFMAPGNTESCCSFPVTHPTSWTYFTEPSIAVDCDFNEWPGTGRGVMVNANASCGCGTDRSALAVQETTWGAVKALYR